MQIRNFILGQEETYPASSKVWAFKYTDDIIHGINLCLSNMVSRFPFTFFGIEWKDSERLYLCGEFSLDNEEHRQIQQRIIDSKSGYAAKRFVKTPNKNHVREDFTDFRLQWMLFCVWQKCLDNADFRHLLMQIPDDVILVENTTTDNQGSADIWGCRNKQLYDCRKQLADQLTESNPQMKKKHLQQLINIETNKLDSIGEWRGQNNIGKILMTCRDALCVGTSPQIDYKLLDNAKIYLLGKPLTFD